MYAEGRGVLTPTKHRQIGLECAIRGLKVRETVIKNRPNDKTAMHRACNGPTNTAVVQRAEGTQVCTQGSQEALVTSRLGKMWPWFGKGKMWPWFGKFPQTLLPFFYQNRYNFFVRKSQWDPTGIMSCLYSSKGNKSNLHNLPPMYYVPFPRKKVT